MTNLTMCKACKTLDSAKTLSAGFQNALPIPLDVNDDTTLDSEVAKHELIISLILHTFHAAVIRSAIRNQKSVVTTIYVLPAMMELDAQYREAGITVMNEIARSGHLLLVRHQDRRRGLPC
jgi:saccharopine dehydrogenase (NADP+, L-glutamate forming)